MALRLIRILAVATVLVLGMMAYGPSEAAAYDPAAGSQGTEGSPPGLTGVAPPDAPAPTEVPQPEPSAEPAPTAVPEPEPSVEPAPTAVPEPEPSVEPAPSAVPQPEPTTAPTPPEVLPQPEPSVEPAPTTEPPAGAIVEPSPEPAATDAAAETQADPSADQLPAPNLAPADAPTVAVRGAKAASPSEIQPVLKPQAPATGSALVSPSSIPPGQATASTAATAPSTETGDGSDAAATDWISAHGPGGIGAIPAAMLEGAEPVSAGVVAGIAATNRAPAVAVAVEFGRAGSGWAGAIVFNLWLRRQMRERRMSQRQLAALSGVNHSTISRLLHLDRHPSLETATKLARALRKAGGELDTADYFDRLPEETLFPARRVELALRGDDLLDESDVQRLMRSYLRARASRRGDPAPLAVDSAGSSDVEAPG